MPGTYLIDLNNDFNAENELFTRKYLLEPDCHC